jgi:uncharacterized LabA/DUF88 family protein
VKYAALFVDYENIYYYLKNGLAEAEDPADSAALLIRSLRQKLSQDYDEQLIVMHAYADFDRMPDNAQSQLYLLGLESHHVLGAEHKNAADMRLCVDAMETLYTQTKIESFVVVGGDRDYIPVIQHFRKLAKLVRCVAFQGSVSGDLLQIIGESYFIDAGSFLPNARWKAREVRTGVPAAPHAVPARPKLQAAPEVFLESQGLDEEEVDAMSVMLTQFPGKPEIWMTPYLHRLRAQMPNLAEFERRALITRLCDAGAIRVEKRPGATGEFSVILVNWNHPDVQQIHV